MCRHVPLSATTLVKACSNFPRMILFPVGRWLPITRTPQSIYHTSCCRQHKVCPFCFVTSKACGQSVVVLAGFKVAHTALLKVLGEGRDLYVQMATHHVPSTQLSFATPTHLSCCPLFCRWLVPHGPQQSSAAQSGRAA